MLRAVESPPRDDATARGGLYDLVGGEIRRVVRSFVGPDDEYEDVVHDAFLAAARGLPRLRDPRRLRGWVRSVASNTALAALRKRVTRRSALRRFPMPPVGEATVEPQLAHDAVRRVCALVARFPLEEREVLVLRYFEELRFDEIVAETGASASTVKRRLRRAHARLRRAARNDAVLVDRLQLQLRG